ncbi:hypothetical protein [Dyella flagellata]|uniref:hypothetical protein n=1 Tax=Dyella flagellata TaxID=1867833 RepID=UPI0024E186B6|nr:hypothetical protein [Dyella flagellata]
MNIDTTSSTESADRDLKKGAFYLLAVLIVGPAFLVISMTTSEGVSLYPSVIKYIVSPAACALALILTWMYWDNFKSKGYRYRNKRGEIKQASPASAAARTLLLLAILVPMCWFSIRGVLRFVVTIESGRQVTTQSTVLGLASGRGCRLVIIYRDNVTSENVSTCQLVVDRTPSIGQPITIKSEVSVLGTRLIGLSFH